MEENKKELTEQDGEREFFTLTDEEGKEVEFELIDTVEYQGVTYYAMIPADAEGENDDGFQEYVILKMEKDEDGEDMLVTLEDDEEFDNVADIFDDRFSEEVDYDGDGDKQK